MDLFKLSAFPAGSIPSAVSGSSGRCQHGRLSKVTEVHSAITTPSVRGIIFIRISPGGQVLRVPVFPLFSLAWRRKGGRLYQEGPGHSESFLQYPGAKRCEVLH